MGSTLDWTVRQLNIQPYQHLLEVGYGSYELSYPTQYFHTIYGSDCHCAWKDTGTECLRLSALLKTGGQLVLVSKRRKDQDVRTLASRLQESYLEAGFIDVCTEYRDLPSGTCVAVKGLKGDPLPYH